MVGKSTFLGILVPLVIGHLPKEIYICKRLQEIYNIYTYMLFFFTRGVKNDACFNPSVALFERYLELLLKSLKLSDAKQRNLMYRLKSFLLMPILYTGVISKILSFFNFFYF